MSFFEPNGELGFITTPAESLLILAILLLPLILVALCVWALRRRRSMQVISASTLKVHTANLSPDSDEVIVIITLDQSAFQELALIDGPLRLTSPGSRPVTFDTRGTRSNGAPTLDPNTGWTIPVSKETQAELRALPTGPGEHELTTTHVAFVVQ